MNKIIKDIHIIVYIKLDFFKSVMIYQFRCINRQYPCRHFIKSTDQFPK